MRTEIVMTVLVIVMVFVFAGRATAADSGEFRDLMSDTWVATDALGRSLPLHDVTGPPRKDRHVALFYFLWMGHHGSYGPYDMTRIRAENPEDPPWGPLHHFHWWAKPELGYYLSNDEAVIRRHAHMFIDAGIDVLFFDATNAVVYTDEYMTLLRVFSQIRKEGGKTPQVAFFAHNSVIQKLYDELYKPNLHPDLWFRWDGKPLMVYVANPAMDNTPVYSEEAAAFFTFREMWGLQRLTKPNTWSFLQHYPQDIGLDEEGNAEFMSVSMAQQETYMSYPTAHGRSYHDGQQPPPEEWNHEGHNAAEQWERALDADPELIFITGWNEWVAQRFEDENGATRFVDAWSEEYNRDIEPMEGGYGDTYYYQMVSYIRRYKGTRPVPGASPPVTIDLDGGFAQWDAVEPAYLDHINDTAHRNHPGFGEAGPYVDTTGRNDFVELKVARDGRNAYFYAETREALTASYDPHWMLLFIDADQNPDTGWEGFDFMVNDGVIDDRTTVLKRRQDDAWVEIAKIPYHVDGNKLMLSVPLVHLKMDADLAPEAPVAFDFYWADNIQRLDDISAYFLHGDTAPARRYRYRFQSNP
jgi:hypothetical protein